MWRCERRSTVSVCWAPLRLKKTTVCLFSYLTQGKKFCLFLICCLMLLFALHSPVSTKKTNSSLKNHKLPHISIWRFCSKLIVKTAHSRCLMTAGSGHMHYSTDWLGLTCVLIWLYYFHWGSRQRYGDPHCNCTTAITPQLWKITVLTFEN